MVIYCRVRKVGSVGLEGICIKRLGVEGKELGLDGSNKKRKCMRLCTDSIE